mgnify:CR=1 FL=1
MLIITLYENTWKTPGKYKIQIWPHEQLYQAIYYNNKYDELDADLVTVVAGQKTDNIDFNFCLILIL